MEKNEMIKNIEFSIEQTKIGLLSCLKRLDEGVRSPEMQEEIVGYQKEILRLQKLLKDEFLIVKDRFKKLKEKYEN